MMSSLCVLKEICSHCPQSNPQMMTSHVSITVVLQKTLRSSALRSSLQKQKGCNQTMPRLWLKHWVDYSLSLTCSCLKRMASCTVSTWSTIHTFSNLLQGLPCTLNVHQLQHHNQIKSKTKKRKEKKTHLREMIHLSEQVSEHGVYVVHLQTVERGIQIF